MRLACGCNEGAIGLLVSVGLYLLLLVFGPLHVGGLGTSLGIAALVAMIGAAAGKAIGLRIARRRWRAAVASIRTEWEAARADPAVPIAEHQRLQLEPASGE